MWCVPVTQVMAEQSIAGATGGVLADVVPAAPELPQAPMIALDGDGYVPLTPARLLDTRPTGNTIDDQFEQGGTLGAGAAIDLTVLDRGGVPASGVEAVVLQVTATAPTVRTWISLYPHGTPGPATSNVNAVPGQVRSNLVIVPVGDDGKVDIWNANGTVHLIADVQGWIPSSNTFTGVTPARLLDTRSDGPALGAGAVRTVEVAGLAGIPSSGVGAVAINLTSVNASIRTWLTVYPSGSARPGSSNLNANGAAPEANLVIVPLGDDGEIDIHNALGSVDVIVDVLGWFPAGPGLVAIDPERVVDTRPGDPVAAGGTIDVDADTVPGVPAAGVGALVVNITSLNATTNTWLTAYPTGAAVPLSSNANPRTMAVVANLAIVKVNADGEFTIRNANGTIDVLIDVVGWLPSDVSTTDDSATVSEDDDATALDVLANDSDADGRPLGIESVDQPANGTVEITGGGTGLTYEPDADYCNDPPGTSPDTFTYHLFGGMSADVVVTVTCVNDAPVAVADEASVAEDDSVEVDVRANDTDVESDAITIDSFTQGTFGAVALSGVSGDPIYTPAPNYCNTPPGTSLDSFTYTVNGGSTATVTVTVTCVDDAPTAVNDEFTVDEDSADNSLTVTANDTDIDGGAFSITSASDSAHGNTQVVGLTVEYTPDPNYCGDDSFTYTLNGGSTATVDLEVTCIDDPTVAVTDNVTVQEDSGANTIDVRANDLDAEGVNDLIVSVIQPTNGSVAITNGGADLTYTPNENVCGDDGFLYTLSGGSMAAVSVNIDCVDDNPVAVADSLTIDEDSSATFIDVIDNDTDVDGGPLSIGAFGAATFGTVSPSGDGFTYTPNANYCGPDSFTYSLTPGGSTATVSITVTCVDDIPIAVADTFDITEDDPATPFDVLANDTDVDAGMKLVISVGDPMLGSVTIDGGGTGLTYTPNANACGIDTFAYFLNGGSGTTVTVDITCVDDAPTAVDDDATVSEDSGATAVAVLGNDTDVDGGPISITSVTQPTNGTVVITGGGTGLTYQPNANYCNTPAGAADEFTYTLSPGGSTATVEMTVTCDDDLAIANDDQATVTQNDPATAIDVLSNDNDVENDPFVITAVDQPANGTVVITGGGTGLTYEPDFDYCNTPGDPTDDFTYTITGGDTATVEMTVECLDDPPTAVNDTATVTEDQPAGFLSVLANDTDPDGGPIEVVSVTQPANGTASVEPDGTGVRYEPDPNFCNSVSGPTDDFTYTLAPGGSTATVSVTVNCVDDAPVAVNDTATVGEDSGATAFDVLANDTDVDAGPISITSVTQPTNGTVVITGGGSGLTYEPDPNYCNNPPGSTLETFTYTLAPGGSTATVTVTVTCVDDNPVAVNDSAGFTEDFGILSIDALTNDTDVDGGSISITSVTQPANGTVAISGGGTGLTYVPNANYCNNPPGSTLDTFTYTLTPGGSTATVSVTVNCVDDAPVAVNDAATVVEDSGANAIGVLANDTDIDGGPKSVTSVTQPANGTVVITGGGTGLTYQPNLNYCNNPPGSTLDTFTYTLAPGGSTATVTVTVTCVDDPPTALNKQYDGVANMRIDIPAGGGLLVGANDVDGILPLSVGTVSATSPAGGVVTHNAANGSFSFTPPPGATGNVTFTYTVCDSTSPTPVCSAAATVTVAVDNDPVVWFVDDSANATGANGTLDKPFKTLAALEADAAFTASTDPRIFVFSGTYSTGFTMPADARLYGQPYIAPASFDDTMGITPVTGLQTRPAFNVGTVTVNGQLTLGATSFVRGLRLTPTSGTALVGSSVSGVDVRSVEIAAVGASGIDLNNVAGIFDLNELSASGPGTGLRLLNSSATVVVRDGDITSTTNGVIIDGSGSSVQFFSAFTLGPIISGRTLLVQNRGSGGSVTFSGPISATGGTGILLNNNNSASNVRLLGKITLSTGTNAAFTGTSGGVVETAVGDLESSITTTTGTALNLTNTAIGADGVVFRSISANGAANGIVLNNTGTAGGNGNLRVQGVTSTPASGGTIQNTTGAAISLTNTKNPTFRYFNIQNSAGSGVQGTGVAGLVFTNSTVNNSGTGGTGSNLAFNNVDANNLNGSVTITNNTLTNARNHGVDILNYSGSLTNVTISNNTITSSTIAADTTGSGVRLQALGNGGGAATVSGATINANTITNFPSGGGILVQAGNSASGGPSVTFGTLSTPITVTNNTIQGASSANLMGTNAIAATISYGGTAHFNISNNGTIPNPVTNVRGTVILVGVNDMATGTFTVNNNVIVANHDALSFASQGIGGGTGTVTINNLTTPQMTITVTNNRVSGTDGDGILLVARGASGLLKATVQNNVAGPPLTGNRYGIRIDAGNASSGTDTVCLNISGNTATGSGVGTGIGLRQQAGKTFGIVGISPSPASDVQAETYVESTNPAAVGGVTIISGSSFTSCTI